jgi:hypothetical protein
MSAITELGPEVWVAKDHKLAIMFGKDSVQDPMGKIKSVTAAKSPGKVDIMSWGGLNTLPQQREALVRNNGILGELIKTKRDFTIGGGLVAYKSVWENGKERKEYMATPPEIEAFFKKIGIHKYLRKAAKNLLQHGNVLTEFTRLRGGQINTMRCLECRHMRSGKQNSDGDVTDWYWSGYWHKTSDKDATIVKIPVLDPNDDKKRQMKFVMHSGDDLVFDDYYYAPTWWGDQVVNMIRVANTIPTFHLNNIDNGYSIRFWIEIPKDYFLDTSSAAQTPEQKSAVIKKAKDAKEEFKKKMDEFLAGAENAGKAIFSEYELNKALGKDFPGIKIHTLNYDIKGDELLKLYAAALQTLIASQGIHPTLASVETSGKLSSGSEMRNAYMVYQKTKTPEVRKILLEAIEFLHEQMGWDPELKWEFHDIEIVSLDQSKTGNVDPIQADPATIQ